MNALNFSAKLSLNSLVQNEVGGVRGDVRRSGDGEEVPSEGVESQGQRQLVPCTHLPL